MKWTGRFEGYNVHAFRRDLIAGLIVGVVAIPLAMSFAIASGVKPQYGIYTTIAAGFLISLLGGSRFQIGGPTGAFVPILLAIVLQYGYENLLLAGMIAGFLLVLMGVFKLGMLIQFIPRPVTIGFTTGIAVIIFTGQIANFLGLRNIKNHEYFLSNVYEIGTRLSSWNGYSILTAWICLAVILIFPKIFPKIPPSLVGLIVSSAVAALFFDGKVETIGSTYGAIPDTLPTLSLPHITIEKIVELLPPALVIALLGGIESLLSAVVADGMSGSKHNSNRELIGQGIANLVTPLFGGIPATGAIARTATNIKNGAASPVSGMVHAIVVLLVLILLAPFASAIPLAGMAPILMVVAWNMSERKHFVRILTMRTSDSIVLAITFLLTVLTNLTTAVEVGLALAVLIFVKRMRDSITVSKGLPDPSQKEKVRAHMVKEGHDCPQISIYTIEGPLFFGAADLFETSITDSIRSHPKVVLLRMGRVPLMDADGEANLGVILKQVKSSGGSLFISGMQMQPRAYLNKSGLDRHIGVNHFFEHTGAAITSALDKLDDKQCLGCKHFAFRECTALSSHTGQQVAGKRTHLSDR
ncbi:SulP family inorganic anion transporter [Paenibacillus piri]|uniref:STAS domain-containing protein n=1 Tax=Paenibacillus piri TaxID=2547395 RepID=A0A4R5KKP1_9BACL|nr:SulP family inorganic anion transporter [Paenibacillus piri]TDF95087.1 STAS domain-containing protein [Paenibacillus piri]